VREDAWLGERLGCPAWTVEDSDTADQVTASGPGFFQAKVPTGDVARVGSLERVGFRTVDVSVTFRRDPGLPLPEHRARVRGARSDDRRAVMAIAEREYDVSRFHLDPAIPDDVARSIKREWVANYFKGARGDRMLVAEHDGRVAGFQLVLDTPETAVIDLIAVAATARGRGIGSSLVCSLAESSPGRSVQTGTQVANLPALRLYERLGFLVAQTQFVLHRHSHVGALSQLRTARGRNRHHHPA
jgi:dTDP-4-amino-4,6-dideoxy-D-galactose acyltransferase